jgi:asparagine synthase (glutamine-hydrolysing)
MCGIAGIVGPGAESLEEMVLAMNAAQRHRGPDDEGTLFVPGVALGHLRLSIIDLSAAGHQPMTSRDGRYSIVYNGEIYNYIELYEELGGPSVFRSACDTEVLLEAFAKWGPDCLQRLRGMFAFAVWDHAERSLFLARDRFGIKPLYYASHGGRTVFASEIKALLAAGVPAVADMATIGEYLTTGLFDHRPRTFFSGVSSLPPGHFVTVAADGSAGEAKPYYRLVEHLDAGLASISLDEAKERYLAKLRQAIVQHQRSDVPLGAMVSGGLDSSALIALMAEGKDHPVNVEAFSLDFPDERYSERRWAEQVVDQTKSTCHFSMVDDATCREALARVVWHQDEPFGGIPTLAWHSVYQQTQARGVIVILDGTGVDECLAGHKAQVLGYLAHLGRTAAPADLEPEVEAFMAFWGDDRDTVIAGMARAAEGAIRGVAIDGTSPVRIEAVRPAHRDHGAPLENADAFTGTAIRDVLYTHLSATKIPRALRFVDRNSMAFSREQRIPFLDHELVELSFSLPEDFLVRDGRNKHIFREAFSGLLPEALRTAPKRTVQSPQREWLKQGPLADLVSEVLASPSALLEEVLDIDEARQVYRRYLAGDDANSNFLWQWVNLDQWYRCFIEGTSPHRQSWPSPVVDTYVPAKRAEAGAAGT